MQLATKDIKGQHKPVTLTKNFVLNYKSQKHKAALLYGPIGVGKTATAYAIANELDYDILEINSSQLRNAESIKSFLNAALGQRSLFFKPKIVLIDEIDNISGIKDRGCIPALIKAIEKSIFPVILTANDPYGQKLKALRKQSQMIEFPAIEHKIILEHLEELAQQKNLTVEPRALSHIARHSAGDMRAAILDLEVCGITGHCTYASALQLSDRKRTESIINALHIIFKSSTSETARTALNNVDLNIDEVFFWLDQNLPAEYAPHFLAKAYYYLSRADVFRGRIRKRQHWRFLVYINDLLTAGISLSKTERNPDFIKYKPTTRILRMWQAKMKFAKRKELAEKLAKYTHTSKKVALRHMPYYEKILQDPAVANLVNSLD